MRLATKVAYNTIIQIISKFISTALGLFSVALITRYLGQTGFGQYTTVITFLAFFAVLADLGLTLVTVQMISDPQNDRRKILNNLFTVRFVSILIFLSLAPLALVFTPYSPVVKWGIIIALLSFLFPALNQILIGLFQVELRMDKVSVAEIVNRIVLLIGVIFIVRFDYGLYGILWATVLASFINFLMLFISSRKFEKIKLEFDFEIWKNILSKSWPLAVTIAFNLIYLRADTLILSLVKSQAEVGIYGASYKVIDVLTTIPFMFAGIILPILTFNWIERNKDAFETALQRSFDLMIICSLPFVVGTQFLASEVMTLVAGDEFAISGDILKILIFATFFIYFGVMFSHAVIALDKQKKMISSYIFVSISSLAAYLILIPKYSYYGAAGVTIYSELAIAIAALYFVNKFSGFWPKLKIFFRSLLASGVMGAFIYFLPNDFYNDNLGLLITVSLAALVYFLSLAMFRGISRKDVLDLLNK